MEHNSDLSPSILDLSELDLAFSNFKNKKVLITGHTGFKGSWLASWLNYLGAKVLGIALDPITSPSIFQIIDLTSHIEDYRVDIRNIEEIEEIFLRFQPDFVFHLAAQSLVNTAFKNPKDTWEVNVIGTVNILECLRKLDKDITAIFITSDKCYKNVEKTQGYSETDILGGTDPYSASKGAAEFVISSYAKTYFRESKLNIKIASARAGNVIGGGDWSDGRLIPDCIKSWTKNKSVELRNPMATRPWQHVLEPLSGYLTLALALQKNYKLHGEAFNFGPNDDLNKNVLDLVIEMSKHWDKVKWEDLSNQKQEFPESNLLQLNCEKADEYLGWRAALNFDETVFFTASWYKTFYLHELNMIRHSQDQIKTYSEIANKKGIKWAKLP
jgi:CDP-glucose 4,6-dehydratase